MPNNYGDYPSKDNILQYLRAVESYFNLDNHIKFNQNVKLIEYVNNTLWNIKTENSLIRTQKKLSMVIIDNIIYSLHLCYSNSRLNISNTIIKSYTIMPISF